MDAWRKMVDKWQIDNSWRLESHSSVNDKWPQKHSIVSGCRCSDCQRRDESLKTMADEAAKRWQLAYNYPSYEQPTPSASPLDAAKEMVCKLSDPDKQSLYKFMHNGLGLRIY